jgi:protein-S-isoprenylcysteine O-methyltransferase Ste14
MIRVEKAITRHERRTKAQGYPNDSRQLRPPRLFAWLASGVTIGLIVVSQFLARGDDPYLRGAGVFVLLLAGVFIFAPFYLLTKYGRRKDGQTYMQAEIVVDRGLYAITRHPQYLGYTFLACGFALLSQHWVAALLAVVGGTLFYVQAVREERYCLARFGELYERYRQRVPRFNAILGITRLLRGSRKRSNS